MLAFSRGDSVMGLSDMFVPKVDFERGMLDIRFSNLRKKMNHMLILAGIGIVVVIASLLLRLDMVFVAMGAIVAVYGAACAAGYRHDITRRARIEVTEDDVAKELFEMCDARGITSLGKDDNVAKMWDIAQGMNIPDVSSAKKLFEKGKKLAG